MMATILEVAAGVLLGAFILIMICCFDGNDRYGSEAHRYDCRRHAGRTNPPPKK